MPSRKTEDLDPILAKDYQLLKEEYESVHPDRTLIVTCTHRTPAEQAELYASGRTKPGPKLTMCDGVKTLSKHNYFPARAVDVAILIGGKAVWDEKYYAEIGAIGTKIGMRWGGNFKSFKDCPHFEI